MTNNSKDNSLDLKSTQDIVWFAFFTALIAVSAFISIPIGPIPFTMQMLTLYFCAFILGPKKAALAVILYLFLGLIGFPFFAGGKSGLAAFLSPTGGFLLSWPLAIFIAGLSRGKNFFTTIVLLLLSLTLVYTMGTVWLMFKLDLSLAKAFAVACAPFILPDLAKIGIAYFLAKVIKTKMNKNLSLTI